MLSISANDLKEDVLLIGSAESKYDAGYFEMTCPCKGSNLDKMLQPAILLCLFKEDLHGFLLIRKLSANPMFRGDEPDKAGVYRYLKKMEESGLLRSCWEMDEESGKPRRIFSITDRGRECLITWYVALKDYSAGLENLTNGIGKILGLSDDSKQ